MQFGLVISLVLHATLLGFALISIGATPPRELKPSEPAVIADVISASELNRMRQGSRDSKLDAAAPKEIEKPDEAKEPVKKPRPVAVAPPPEAAPPEPETPPKPVETASAEPPPPAAPQAAPPPPKPAPPPPKPEPDKAALDQKLEELALQKATEDKARQEAEAKAKADAEAKAEAEAQAKAKAEAQAKAAEEKKKRDLAEKKKQEADKKKKELAEKKKRDEKRRKEAQAKASREKSKLDTNRLAKLLLDKTPDAKSAAAANPDPDSTSRAKGPVRGDTQGRDRTISANEASFLAGLMRQAVSRCWNINAGLDGIQQMVVKIEVRLSANGEIQGQPRVVNTSPSPVFRDAADSAVRALIQCQPYSLPPDKYAHGWEHMILTFDPARMF